MNGQEKLTIEQKVEKEEIKSVKDNGQYIDPISEEYHVWRNNRMGKIVNEWGRIDHWRPLDTNAWRIKTDWSMLFTS